MLWKIALCLLAAWLVALGLSVMLGGLIFVLPAAAAVMLIAFLQLPRPQTALMKLRRVPARRAPRHKIAPS